jgi:hypothetical protein
MAKYFIKWTAPESRAIGTLAVMLVIAWLVATPAAQTPRRGNSAAAITGAFADSCRDFAVHSSKDISHVETHYVSGGVIKDESISSSGYTIDGVAGDEIAFAIVKSGTTSEQFDCLPSNTAPTARLEIKTPPNGQTLDTCYDFFAGGLICEQSSPRTAWTGRRQIPDNGGTESGVFHWGCGALSHPSLCAFTISFRGMGSSDPDGDITSWSLDFGDGTSTSGSWSTAVPAEITHDYVSGSCSGATNVCMITLTVTDSAGQSHSESIVMAFIDQTPD